MKDNKKVVWFNNWFSAIVVTINDLKKEFPDVTFIGSNGKLDCTYKDAVDKFVIEPVTADSELYVTWALDFCKNNINLQFVIDEFCKFFQPLKKGAVFSVFFYSSLLFCYLTLMLLTAL